MTRTQERLSAALDGPIERVEIEVLDDGRLRWTLFGAGRRKFTLAVYAEELPGLIRCTGLIVAANVVPCFAKVQTTRTRTIAGCSRHLRSGRPASTALSPLVRESLQSLMKRPVAHQVETVGQSLAVFPARHGLQCRKNSLDRFGFNASRQRLPQPHDVFGAL